MRNNNIYKYEKFFYNMDGEKIRDDIYSAILELECESDLDDADELELLLILEGMKESVEEIENLLQELKR